MWSTMWSLVVLLSGVFSTIAAVNGNTSFRAPVCGMACVDDNDCPDPSGLCTYCTDHICQKQNVKCGGPPNETDPNLKAYLMVGDSISIGIQPYLFPELSGYDAQHIHINGGPSSKGYACVDEWVGSPGVIPWDTITFNFGLHSLDNPPTSETESIGNYTKHLKYIGETLLNRSKHVVWVDTTPVPLNVTVGPKRGMRRHNRDVIRYNQAAQQVMSELGIPSCSAYDTIMKACGNTSGSPDFTYTSCVLQDVGGVHFRASGYTLLMQQMVQCITGHTAPPTPPPPSCDDVKRTLCPHEEGQGTACCKCVAAHRGDFDKAGCFNDSLPHPAVDFCHRWCQTTGTPGGDYLADDHSAPVGGSAMQRLENDTRTYVHEMLDVVLANASQHARPFHVNVTARVTGPPASHHPHLTVPAFFDTSGCGNRTGCWRFRFTPDVAGLWHYVTACADSDVGLDLRTGSFTVEDGGNALGALRLDPDHPGFMRYDSGAAFLPVGLEVDWLFALGLEPDTAAPALEDFVGGLADVGFNHVLMNVFANQSAWNQGLAPLTPPRVSPTHTTPWAGGAPLDYDTLDTRFFAHVDRTLTVLLQHNMTANLMLYVGNKAVQWPARNSPADDLYWRYCMARFGAFPNVVLDVSKEAGSYGVGEAYAVQRMQLMHAMNAHGRIVTAHGPGAFSGLCPSATTPSTAHARVGHHATALCDMFTIQKHYANWSSGGGSVAAPWYAFVREARTNHTATPMLVAEFLYEAGAVRGCAGSCCGGCHEGCKVCGRRARPAHLGSVVCVSPLVCHVPR
eukprot:m.835112 g.835112  ORF g.835112 m.835112 type:complete len:792 (+) comp23452_c0_seq18:82-2457(+)